MDKGGPLPLVVTGVYVVHCRAKDGFVGMSMTWISDVETSHILMSVPKSAYATSWLGVDARFSLSALARDQLDVARVYGGKAVRHKADLDRDAIETRHWDMPVIREARGWSLNQVTTVTDLNHQTLIAARVLDRVAGRDAPPLMYRDGDYF